MEVVDVPNSKRPTTLALSADDDHAAGGPDLISSLNDDVLLRILELAWDARALVRTGSLSRRWRGLWTRATVLIFLSSPVVSFRSVGDAERYAAFVTNVLAQRARSSDNVLKHLHISYAVGYLRQDVERLVLMSIKAAQGWVRYAVQHEVKSFRLYLSLPRSYAYDISDDDDYPDSDDGDNYDDSDDDYDDDVYNEEKRIIVLDKLPRCAEKLETMVLSFLGARVRLPGDVVFSSLTDLSLQLITVPDGSERRFARFLSTACCPRLKKLYMWGIRISGSKKLLLEADALSELTLVEVVGSKSLKLKAPSLRVLRIQDCYLKALSILAPKLEELTFLNKNVLGTDQIMEGDFSSVRRLELQLHSHRHTDVNDTRVSLLRRCTSATCLHVTLVLKREWESTVDLIEGNAPKLPHVTSLVVRPYIFQRLGIGDEVASLLSRFSNLRFLGLHLGKLFEDLKDDVLHSGSESNDGPDYWKSYDVSFSRLQEAEVSGLTGTDSEFRFLQYVLASAKELEKVTVRFSTKCFQEGMGDYLERLQLGRGSWSACRDAYSYRWTPCPYVSGECT